MLLSHLLSRQYKGGMDYKFHFKNADLFLLTVQNEFSIKHIVENLIAKCGHNLVSLSLEDLSMSYDNCLQLPGVNILKDSLIIFGRRNI